MVLIDKHANKRTILSIVNNEIWLSHKYGQKSKFTGVSWNVDNLVKNFKNWIFKDYL